jgi:serine/threonine protein kinase
MLGGDLSRRWQGATVLKRDLFSTIERGRYRTGGGDVDAVLRRIDETPWYSRLLAKILFEREVRALKRVPPGIAPPLLAASNRWLVRGFLNGAPLHIARPTGDLAYFASAKSALRSLHRAGICHNDLAKEQNWLCRRDGHAALLDFQLASTFARRGKLFRIFAYEDLRHLLKHKRRYAPEALTAHERKVLSRKSLLTRIWMASGKKLYYLATRGIFKIRDREGAGTRLSRDAPLIEAALKHHPQVTDAVVVAYPDRRAGTGLYGFVEAPGVDEAGLKDYLKRARSPAPPEHLQLVEALPRRSDGTPLVEILQLIALNQLDQISSLTAGGTESATISDIASSRRNLRDRISY